MHLYALCVVIITMSMAHPQTSLGMAPLFFSSGVKPDATFSTKTAGENRQKAQKHLEFQKSA